MKLLLYILITLLTLIQFSCNSDLFPSAGGGKCPPGYSGPQCEVKDSCYGIACGQGMCKGGDCECPPTFTGKNCEKSAILGRKYKIDLICWADNITLPGGYKNRDTVQFVYFSNNKEVIAFHDKDDFFVARSEGRWVGPFFSRNPMLIIERGMVAVDGSYMQFRIETFGEGRAMEYGFLWLRAID